MFKLNSESSNVIYLYLSKIHGEIWVFYSIAGILAATSRDSFKREATETISRPSHGQNGWLHIHITGATGDIALGMSPQRTASPFAPLKGFLKKESSCHE